MLEILYFCGKIWYNKFIKLVRKEIMDEEKILVIAKGEDKTKDIEYFSQ